MGRLVVVSNRVAPVAEGKPAAGGLAVGVLDALKRSGGLWFGWSGEVAEAPALEPRLADRGGLTFATVDLARADYDTYYAGFANGTLWPTFHYRIGLARYDRQDYAGYQRVNRWLAARLMPLLRPDDTIWVHDYHLMHFAEALREAGCRQRIGFFLHTPFPAPQVLLTVPPHAGLMRAMCCHDLVGFQTDTDRQAFLDYLLRHAGGSIGADGRLRAHGRELGVGTYPIGIDPAEVRASALANHRLARRLQDSLSGRRLILGVDRLDYSKGLAERFRAFGTLLERSPHHVRQVSLVQIAPPSRSDVQSYRQIRRDLEAEAGRINGRFAEIDWTPIRYLNRSYARASLMGLFEAADIGMVTPLRDGMNLVAKEYVAAQEPQDPGVLLLSCFAGAAQELGDGAVVVNPFDTTGMAEALDRALVMPLDERRQRHAAMMARLTTQTIARWRDRFLGDLAGGVPAWGHGDRLAAGMAP